MRIARTLALAIAAAIAALALSASAASAANPIEFSLETGEHCNFAERNCEVVAHSESETLVVAHVFGFEVDQSRCLDEFTGYVGENGEGHIVNQLLTQGPSNTCTKVVCSEEIGDGTEGEWPFQMEEDGPGNETMHVTFCLMNPDESSPRHCTITVQANLNHHTGEFHATDEECEEGLVEVTGHWNVERDESDEIEDIH